MGSARWVNSHHENKHTRTDVSRRDAILNGTFPDYLRTFFAKYFEDVGYPKWCVDALRSVGVDLLEGRDVLVVPGSGAKWE